MSSELSEFFIQIYIDIVNFVYHSINVLGNGTMATDEISVANRTTAKGRDRVLSPYLSGLFLLHEKNTRQGLKIEF